MAIAFVILPCLITATDKAFVILLLVASVQASVVSLSHRQKAYKELLELFEKQTGRAFFGKCLASLKLYRYNAKTRRVKRVTRGLIQTLQRLHKTFYSLEVPGSEYARQATAKYYDGETKWAVVDILHKIPINTEEAVCLSRQYLELLRRLIEKLAHDIVYLKQYGLENT